MFATSHHQLMTSDINAKLNLLVESINSNFSAISEHKLISHLKRCDLYLDASEFDVFPTIQTGHRQGETSLVSVKATVMIVPLAFQIRKIFELPHALTTALNYEEQLRINGTTHFVTAPAWQKRKQLIRQSLPDDAAVIMPFFLYLDDAGINNTIGNHKNAMTFLYMSFPLMEDNRIYLVGTFSAKHAKEQTMIQLCQLHRHPRLTIQRWPI